MPGGQRSRESSLDRVMLPGRCSSHRAVEKGRGVAASMYPQLIQDVVNVVLDRGNLHAEVPSDFLIAEPTADEAYNLPLPVTEMGLTEVGVRPTSERRNPPQQHRCDPGGTDNLTPSDACDNGATFGRRVITRDVPYDGRFGTCDQLVFGLGHCEGHHPDARGPVAHCLCDRDAVGHGH